MSKATQTFLLKPNPPQPDAVENRSRFALYYELNRLHKFPAGELLIFWPCAWALTMTGYRSKQPLHDYGWTIAVIALLSTLIHSAACVINDICDRELDRQVFSFEFYVERTKNRPLASGAISLGGAITCLLIESSAFCAYELNLRSTYRFLVGLFGIFPLHGLYPLMKRLTYWPQAWLGLNMNWGYIVVWVLRVRDQDYRVPIVFFAGTICWTVVYDTIYGCQDKKDDANAGIKSTALLFGSYVRPILAVFAAGFVAAIAGAGYLNHQERAYYVVSVGGAALHLMWQLVTLKDNDPEDCWKKFQSNGFRLGFIVHAGMLFDYLNVLP
ncbi:UbiA prenyltransferase family [Pholiota molesta]|nr:UbiA prenyltransferase family [Pholiota molesta]